MPWSIAGLGSAGLTAGLVMGVLSEERDRAKNDKSLTQKQAGARDDEARTLSLGANIAFASGGVGLLQEDLLYG